MALLNSFVLFSLFHLVTSSKMSIHVPVLYLDYDNVMAHIIEDPNPFARMSTYRFSDLLHNSVRRSLVVLLFIEDFLSTEDLSSKDKLGTPYSYIHQGLINNQVKYFPGVTDPYDVITQIFPKVQMNMFYVQSEVHIPRNQNMKYIYINFQDGGNETRIEKLRRHDIIVREACGLVRKMRGGPVIGVYTGLMNPFEGDRTTFLPIKPERFPRSPGVMVVSTGALFRFAGVYGVYASSTRRFSLTQMPLVSGETFTRKSMNTKMAYDDFEIEFNFGFREDGWVVDYVALFEAGEEVGRTDMGVGAPWNWSYVCGEPLTIVNTRDDSSVTISQYQIQPRLTDFRRYSDGMYMLMASGSNDTATCFGKSVNCGPYFNTNILTALLITFTLLSITMFGIVAMINCVSNDRMEDPNGPQLTIKK